jgi:hypothetical protein
MTTQTLTAENFEETVASNEIVLVDFWAVEAVVQLDIDAAIAERSAS